MQLPPCAAGKGDLAACRRLVEQGADPNWKTRVCPRLVSLPVPSTGYSRLSPPLRANLPVLPATGAALGNTPLHRAAEEGHLEVQQTGSLNKSHLCCMQVPGSQCSFDPDRESSEALCSSEGADRRETRETVW